MDVDEVRRRVPLEVAATLASFPYVPDGFAAELDAVLADASPTMAPMFLFQQANRMMLELGFSGDWEAFEAGRGPVFVPTRSQYEAAKLMTEPEVRELLVRVAERVAAAGDKALERTGLPYLPQQREAARIQRRDTILELEMQKLGYEWSTETHLWRIPWRRRLAHVGRRAFVVVAAIASLGGIFLVPTTAAAAARVSYMSAAVSVMALVVPLLWKRRH